MASWCSSLRMWLESRMVIPCSRFSRSSRWRSSWIPIGSRAVERFVQYQKFRLSQKGNRQPQPLPHSPVRICRPACRRQSPAPPAAGWGRWPFPPGPAAGTALSGSARPSGQCIRRGRPPGSPSGGAFFPARRRLPRRTEPPAPRVGRVSPHRIRSRVVFPAPFSPIRAVNLSPRDRDGHIPQRRRVPVFFAEVFRHKNRFLVSFHALRLPSRWFGGSV